MKKYVIDNIILAAMLIVCFIVPTIGLQAAPLAIAGLVFELGTTYWYYGIWDNLTVKTGIDCRNLFRIGFTILIILILLL